MWKIRWTALGAIPLAVGLTALIAMTARSGPARVSAPNPAAPNFYAWIRLTGIEGEATKRGHERWIQVLEFNWGVTATEAGPRGGTARPAFEELTVTKYLDKSSPLLAAACAEGRIIPEARLVFYGPAGTSSAPLGIVSLVNARVAKTTTERTAAATSERPVETIGLQFGKIEWSYNEIEPLSGQARNTAKAGWDLEANRPM